MVKRSILFIIKQSLRLLIKIKLTQLAFLGSPILPVGIILSAQRLVQCFIKGQVGHLFQQNLYQEINYLPSLSSQFRSLLDLPSDHPLVPIPILANQYLDHFVAYLIEVIFTNNCFEVALLLVFDCGMYFLPINL